LKIKRFQATKRIYKNNIDKNMKRNQKKPLSFRKLEPTVQHIQHPRNKSKVQHIQHLRNKCSTHLTPTQLHAEIRNQKNNKQPIF